MKGEKKKKSVEKCKGADVKAIPENSIYLSMSEFGFDCRVAWMSQKCCVFRLVAG